MVSTGVFMRDGDHVNRPGSLREEGQFWRREEQRWGRGRQRRPGVLRELWRGRPPRPLSELGRVQSR